MVRQIRSIITEEERNRILGLYGVKNQSNDFVFDMVLTENQKYLIFMDQVFVNGGDGKSIGSIWENTHIFNEIVYETLDKIETLQESIKKDVVTIFETFQWKKEDVKKWIEDETLLNEESWWESIKSGTSDLLNKFGQASVNAVSTVFKQGVLPALRWIRRQLYTTGGIIVDVAASILFPKSTALIWVAIVLLDIYEIGVGNYDPKDPDRMQMPFFFLLADAIGALFTGASAILMKKAAPKIAQGGIKEASPAIVNLIKSAANKVPSLKSMLNNVAKTLTTKFGEGGLISKMLGFADKVLGQLQQFLGKIFSKQGLKAAGTGTVVAGVAKGIEHGVPMIDKKNKIGQFAVDLETKARETTGLGQMKFTKSQDDFALDYVKNYYNLNNTQ